MVACSDKVIILIGRRRASQERLTILGACNHTACGSSHFSHLRGSYREVSRRHCPACAQFNAIEYSFGTVAAIHEFAYIGGNLLPARRQRFVQWNVRVVSLRQGGSSGGAR